MTGILYQTLNEIHRLVTLTTAPNFKCGQYHKRMPVMILPENVEFWFQSQSDQLLPLFKAIDES